MLVLALGVVASFVIGLVVTLRFKPDNFLSVATQVIGISLGMVVVAGVLGLAVLNLRGWELVGTAVLWGLILPAAMLGNWVRMRVRPRTRL